MFWHLDADIVSLLVLVSLFIYCIFIQSDEQLNRSDKLFLLMLITGGIATAIDIIASAIMNSSISPFWYYFFMILYFAGFEGIMLIWFCYNSSLIFAMVPKISKRLNVVFTIPFLIYLALLGTTPFTGWFFQIAGEENHYTRGPLFLLAIGLYSFYAVSILFIATVRRKTIPDKYPLPIFIFGPILLILGILIQLIMKGWLLILPAYMLSIVVIFLFLQAKQYTTNEKTKDRIRNYTTHVPCGLIIGSINTKHQFLIQNINQAYFDLLEEPREYMLSRYNTDIFAGVHVQDRPHLKEVIDDLCQYHRDQEFFYRFVTRKNKIKWFQAQVRAIHNEDNTAIAYITISEITSLIDKIHQFEAILENLPCGIALFKVRGRNIHHLYHNKELLFILGIPKIVRYSTLDKIDLSLIHNEDVEPLKRVTREGFRDSNTLSFVYRFYNPKKEKYIKIQTDLHKMLDSEGNDIVFLICRDLSNLNETKKLIGQ